MKVTIGLILSHGFPVPASFVTGWTSILHTTLTGAGNALLPKHLAVDSARVLESFAFPIDAARNELVRMFLDNDNGDYLLFLDADMKHPPELVHKLVARQKDIVTARYVMRRPPFFTVAMKKTGDGPHDYQAVDKMVPEVKGLIPIDAAGAGCLLIKRSVLQMMRAHIGDNWFQYQVGQSGLRDVSEDMWFFEQAKISGYQAWLDADVECGHVASFEVDPKWHIPYLDAYREANKRLEEAPA